MQLFGVKKQDRSNKQAFTINVEKSRSKFSTHLKRTTSVPRRITIDKPNETSKAGKDTEDFDNRVGFDSNPDYNGDNQKQSSDGKKNVNTYTTGTESEKGFNRTDVIYTLGVSLSTMVVITVIAVLIIFIIKRRRQQILREMHKSIDGTTNTGN
jgi:hypothetical protein